MPTFTAFSTAPDKERAARLGEILERLRPEPTGIGVFEIEDGSGRWEVGAYFTEKPAAVELDLLAAATGAAPFVVSQLPETDWVAKVKRDLSPVRAGRFVVHGSHDAENLPDDAIGLLIEASMAFGTGHHGTTLGCLRALDRLIGEGQGFECVADIGCGTAVLAMAAARMGSATVIASDIDPVAVEVAEANIRANGLQGRVTCVEAAGCDHPALIRFMPFDLVFANILKGPLIDMAPDISAATKAGGTVILSGILNEQADEVVAAYARERYNIVEKEKIGDWTTLVLRKIG